MKEAAHGTAQDATGIGDKGKKDKDKNDKDNGERKDDVKPWTSG